MERAFALLRAVALHGTSVPLAVIAAETGLPKSTVSRLLTTMAAIGAIDRVGDGLYSIGPELHTIVQPAVGLADLTAIARPFLRELVDEIGEDAGLAIPDGFMVLYFDRVQSSNPVQVKDWTGKRFAAHTTAAGYVFLGALETALLDRFLEGELERPTSSTVVDPKRLRRLVREAAQAGHAWTYATWAEGINGAAAPIRDSTGQVVAAINLYGPSYRFPGADDKPAITRRLVEAAGHVSRHLRGGNV